MALDRSRVSNKIVLNTTGCKLLTLPIYRLAVSVCRSRIREALALFRAFSGLSMTLI